MKKNNLDNTAIKQQEKYRMYANINKYSNQLCADLIRYKITFAEWKNHYEEFCRFIYLNVPGLDYIRIATLLKDATVIELNTKIEEVEYLEYQHTLSNYISKAQQSFRDSIKNDHLYIGLDGKDYYEYGYLLAANRDYMDHYYREIKIPSNLYNEPVDNKKR